jgi:hypothetical protein
VDSGTITVAFQGVGGGNTTTTVTSHFVIDGMTGYAQGCTKMDTELKAGCTTQQINCQTKFHCTAEDMEGE